MNTNTAIIMLSTIVIDKNSQLYKKRQLTDNDDRMKNYISGLTSLNKVLNEQNMIGNIDIYLLDNSVGYECLPDEFKSLLTDLGCVYLNNSKNNLGKINKGAGLIETWKDNIDIINKYDTIIHFEPRLEIYDNIFFTNYFENKKNYFCIDRTGKQFFTGLFSIKSTILLNFINETNENELVSKKISIEKSLFDFITKYNTQFINLNKIGVIWNDSFAKKNHYL